MNVSFDYHAYQSNREFFTEFARAMQAAGNKVGIITGNRDRDVFSNEDLKEKMVKDLSFVPDFVRMWGQTETIGNGGLWKAIKMDEEDVIVHFDSDGTAIKRYTERDVFKTMDNGQRDKF